MFSEKCHNTSRLSNYSQPRNSKSAAVVSLKTRCKTKHLQTGTLLRHFTDLLTWHDLWRLLLTETERHSPPPSSDSGPCTSARNEENIHRSPYICSIHVSIHTLLTIRNPSIEVAPTTLA